MFIPILQLKFLTWCVTWLLIIILRFLFSSKNSNWPKNPNSKFNIFNSLKKAWNFLDTAGETHSKNKQVLKETNKQWFWFIVCHFHMTKIFELYFALLGLFEMSLRKKAFVRSLKLRRYFAEGNRIRIQSRIEQSSTNFCVNLLDALL